MPAKRAAVEAGKRVRLYCAFCLDQTGPSYCFRCCRNPCLATTQVPRNANTVTKTAVGMVELFPSLLLNLASGPQIAVMKTATHMAVIASDAHISGMSRNDHHRGRSCTTREGSCDMVDIF